MRSAYLTFFSVVLIALVACNAGADGEKKPAAADTTHTAPPPRIDLSKTDSIELLHFADPANLKIYSRSLITDTHFIEQIRRNVEVMPVTHGVCGNDFKLFFFRNGEVYKTIYAATADTCRYFAYVINGETFFTNMNDSARAMLKAQVKP
ncbi:hypothetical protein [Longitalea luteola]|uniref:hypothetical protein n=1 Tax=Longitalea luteola TaxID=2812563 RepID=UPI001A97AF38|nr:hypothetical protein [Longitalea luteola]